MKNIIGFIAIVLLIVGISSCKKRDNITQPIQKATNIGELNPAPTFNWQTHKDVTFNVTGLPINIDVKRKLIVKDDKGTLYYNVFHNMKDNLSTTITLPIHIESVIVEYGTISKIVEVAGNTIKFDFTQDIPNDLD